MCSCPIGLGSSEVGGEHPLNKNDLRYKRFGRLENENEKIRLNTFCQHEKVRYAEFTR